MKKLCLYVEHCYKPLHSSFSYVSNNFDAFASRKQSPSEITLCAIVVSFLLSSVLSANPQVGMDRGESIPTAGVRPAVRPVEASFVPTTTREAEAAGAGAGDLLRRGWFLDGDLKPGVGSFGRDSC